jgi:CubicO group peptidase (beta-lactamase class C family)
MHWNTPFMGLSVSAGIGAKLLCSAEYVIGNNRAQAFEDMSQYSPILEKLDVTYDEQQRSVTASLYGLAETTATYLPGLGCAIDYDGHTARQGLVTRTLPISEAPWPAGDTVTTIKPDLQALIDDIVAQDNQEGLNTRALVVVHGGQIVAEHYAQGTTERTQLLGWSMAKSMTSIMLGNLELRGLIDLTATPGFSEWSGDSRADIRIDQLLTMTDGLDFSEEYNRRRFHGDAVHRSLCGGLRDGEASGAPAGHTLQLQLGHRQSAGSPLHRHAGLAPGRYDDLLDHVFIPMGFQNATLEMDASGAFVGSSYLYASGREWARMGQMMLNGGTLNGQRIVSADWVERATTPNSSSNNRSYGYQWWLNAGDATLSFPTLPEDAFNASGNREQTVMVFPSEDTVIVRLGWTAGNYPEGLRFRRILDALQ